MGRDRNKPPSEWEGLSGVVKLADDIYCMPSEVPGETTPYFWHWCEPRGLWSCHHTANHTVVSVDPLHLEPSLLWPCCGTHGFVRDGRWIPA